jgi:hypothetical protein
LQQDLFKGILDTSNEQSIDKNVTAPELQPPPAGEAVQAQETPVAPGTAAPEGAPNATQ